MGCARWEFDSPLPDTMSENRAKQIYSKKIIHYYDSSQLLYRIFCYGFGSFGMHHGFWEKGVKNRYEAMEKENQAIIDLAAIGPKDTVLDAGCGVGDTAIYIAKKVGVCVFGITLSQKQVGLAKQYAKRQGVEKLVNFSVQDYTKTTLPHN